MKKVLSIVMIMCLTIFSAQTVVAQEDTTNNATENTEEPAADASEDENTTIGGEEGDVEETKTKHQVIKEKFIEGGAAFMALPLLCLILGLAIAVERIISLHWVSINTDKFVKQINDAVAGGDIEGAKELSRKTKGPIASIFYQGLDRSDQGSIDAVEKAVVSYGSVQMGQLEKGLVWLSLFIALAPMLGFMGTVIGMIDAFDSIEKMGDISAGAVAGGIKIALLTTVAGLIVAIILQVFYNYLVTKVDSLVNNMEDASISLVDILVKNKVVKG